uniref:Uncharacterized protein n=1 Tax=Siphoviridae sp. ctvph17 TaxID=2825724 RepID=A0A8S5UJL4_9CAUD|nr:MAG TPA: hypothetical protein [Siphoviridae sp. ctvph17]
MLVGSVRWGCDLRLCVMVWVTISLATYPLSHWWPERVNTPS